MPEPARLPEILDISNVERFSVDFRTLTDRLPAEHVDSLAREVVTRLAAARERAAPVDRPATAAEVETLANLLISNDVDAGARMIRKVRGAGASVETVYLSYLAEASRLLGEWWDADRVTFIDVSLGTSRIYAILRSLRNAMAHAAGPAPRQAVFASVPGESHTLGVSMAAELFRRKGWEIDLHLGLPHDELVDRLTRARPRVVGLSAGGGHAMPALARLVVAVRAALPGALLLIGGKAVDLEHDGIALLGADAITSDVTVATRKLKLLADIADPDAAD